jgi:hypothetical protein
MIDIFSVIFFPGLVLVSIIINWIIYKDDE